MSLREYSAHRMDLGLPGSLFAIQAAIKRGKISRTCPEHDKCPPECKAAKIDPHQADLDWEAWTDATHSADDAKPANILEAQLQRLTWQARLDRQRFEERQRILIQSSEVQGMIFRMGRQIRDSLLMIPRRVAGRVVTVKDRRKVEKILEEEIRASLKGLDKDVLRKPS